MHGNSPHDGPGGEEPTATDRDALRREMTAVTSQARDLLPDEFVVGSEIVEDDGGLRATVVVQPPAGSVVSAGFEPGEADDLARDLAAGAALEMKRSGGFTRTGR
jgi:hypothetical protein